MITLVIIIPALHQQVSVAVDSMVIAWNPFGKPLSVNTVCYLVFAQKIKIFESLCVFVFLF